MLDGPEASRSGAVLRPGGVLWLAITAVVLFALGFAGSVVTPLDGEVAVAAAVAGWRSSALTAAVHLVTTLGDSWFVVLAALVVAWIVRSSRWAPRVHTLLLVTIGGSTFVVAALKLVVARARPADALVTTLTSAYPSGHAARAAAVYGLVAWACARYVERPLLRAAGMVAAVLLGVAIVISRLYLGVHLPSEVVAGAVIGGLWLVATLRTVRVPGVSPSPGHTGGDRAPEGR